MEKCDGKLIIILWYFGLDIALFLAFVPFLGKAAAMTLQDIGSQRSSGGIFHWTEWHQLCLPFLLWSWNNQAVEEVLLQLGQILVILTRYSRREMFPTLISLDCFGTHWRWKNGYVLPSSTLVVKFSQSVRLNVPVGSLMYRCSTFCLAPSDVLTFSVSLIWLTLPLIMSSWCWCTAESEPMLLVSSMGFAAKATSVSTISTVVEKNCLQSTMVFSFEIT